MTRQKEISQKDNAGALAPAISYKEAAMTVKTTSISAALYCAPQLDRGAALELVRQYRAEGLSLKDAAKKAAAESGFSRNELYSAALKEE